MSAAAPLDAAMSRLHRLLEQGPSPTEPVDAWLADALLQAADAGPSPDDQELAAYAEGGLSDERRAAVEQALLADADLRTSFLLFSDALSALAEDEAKTPEAPRAPLRVVDGSVAAPSRRRAPPTRWLALAVAAIVVFGLSWQLRESSAPPIDARLLVDFDAPTVRATAALPAGAQTVQIVARVPAAAWWTVVAGRPGGATRGPRLDVVRPPQKAADSPHFERNHVLFEGPVPSEAGELAYFIVVSERAPEALPRVVSDSLVRLGDRDDVGDDFARAMHSELSAGAEAHGWRLSKTVRVSVRGL